MGWLQKILGLFDSGRGVDELARRLGMPEEELRRVEPVYREFAIRKKSGGKRRIHAPVPELKSIQRRILRRLLDRLKTHPAAVGFVRTESFVTNARRHRGRAVVVRFDIKDFFPSTGARSVGKYFRRIGWSREATRLLLRLCTHAGSLPQGAPTSPRLSNLVNIRLDARLGGLAAKYGAVYTRYADDMTFSFDEHHQGRVTGLMRIVRLIAADEGYRLHRRKKVHVRRRHQRQEVTGLVVNERVNLPRETRRWLRAVEHRAAQDWRTRPLGEGTFTPAKRPTLSDEQLAGWRSLVAMIDKQASDPSGPKP